MTLTSNEIHKIQFPPVVEMMNAMIVEVMRNKTPAQRLAIAFRMWDSARMIVKGGIQYQHPEWSDA